MKTFLFISACVRQIVRFCSRFDRIFSFSFLPSFLPSFISLFVLFLLFLLTLYEYGRSLLKVLRCLFVSCFLPVYVLYKLVCLFVVYSVVCPFDFFARWVQSDFLT